MSFAKNVGKNLGNKYGQKLPDSAKKSATDAIKTVSKRAIQKIAEATDDLIGNKIAGKITSVFKNIAFKWITFKNKWEWNRYIKRKINISWKKTSNYWWIKISIII